MQQEAVWLAKPKSQPRGRDIRGTCVDAPEDGSNGLVEEGER